MHYEGIGFGAGATCPKHPNRENAMLPHTVILSDIYISNDDVCMLARMCQKGLTARDFGLEFRLVPLIQLKVLHVSNNTCALIYGLVANNRVWQMQKR